VDVLLSEAERLIHDPLGRVRGYLGRISPGPPSVTSHETDKDAAVKAAINSSAHIEERTVSEADAWPPRLGSRDQQRPTRKRIIAAHMVHGHSKLSYSIHLLFYWSLG